MKKNLLIFTLILGTLFSDNSIVNVESISNKSVVSPSGTGLNKYASLPQNQTIKKLREIFSVVRELENTNAEVAYTQTCSKMDLSVLNDVSVEDLLRKHWDDYAYDAWTVAMDNISVLLRLETCETVYEAGFGSGAPLSYFKEKYPKLGVSGNDFYESYVHLAKNSKLISDGAFIHANSRQLDFIPDNTLDAVLAWGSIGYEDEEGTCEIFKHLIRICKPGGRILIGNMDNLEDHPLKIGYNTAYQTSFSIDKLKRIMENEPVRIVELDTDNKVIGIENHLADRRLTICLEKLDI